MSNHSCRAVLLALSVLPILTASGQVAYTTLDSQGSYDAFTGRGINGSAFRFGYQAWANRLVATRSGYLSSIDLGVHYALYDSAPGDQVDVRLARDVDGQFSSALTLATGTVTLTSSFGSSDLAAWLPGGAVPISSGSAYWLAVTPHSTTTVADWCPNSLGITGAYAVCVNGVSWLQDTGATLNAFRVNVVPVPEPASLGLAIAGLTGTFLLRRRAGSR